VRARERRDPREVGVVDGLAGGRFEALNDLGELHRVPDEQAFDSTDSAVAGSERSDNFDRKFPDCQDGAPGLPLA
jgi:hypothetical protein